MSWQLKAQPAATSTPKKKPPPRLTLIGSDEQLLRGKDNYLRIPPNAAVAHEEKTVSFVGGAKGSSGGRLRALASTANRSWAGVAASARSRTPSPITMVDPIFDYQFRLILIGDSTVGKSSLLRYFTEGTFAEVSDPTVGVDFFARLVQVSDGTAIKLQLWDTAGQERFRSITKSYYRNSVGALLVYDICNRDSFKHIPVWLMEARRHIEPHKAVFILVGAKLDLGQGTAAGGGARREVSAEEAQQLADAHGIDFVETSAKSGHRVEEAFVRLAQKIHDKIGAGEYRLEDGWDGIKRGYHFGGAGAGPANRRRMNLIEAEATGRKCC